MPFMDAEAWQRRQTRAWRTASLALVVVSLLISWPARADDAVQKVLDRAITAHGGAELLGKATAEKSKARGTVLIGGGLPFTQEVHLELPARLRDLTTLDVMGNKVSVLLVLDGERGWVRANDETTEMDPKLLVETREAVYLARLLRLVPLREKGFELSAQSETMIEGRKATGIKVASKGHRDVNLYFDEETGLLLSVRRPVHDFMADKEVVEERIFTDYGKVEGLRVARKFHLLRDGKKFMDVEVVQAELVDKHESSLFTKP